MIGYWFLESPKWQPPPELVNFLNREPKAIYIGFGSVTVPDPAGLTRIIIESVVKTGQRAVLVKGWGGIGNIEYPDNIFAIDSVPHDWLFPQLSAVVHHGGAGTVAAGLRAGLPTLVVPFFGDQFFWGHRVSKVFLKRHTQVIIFHFFNPFQGRCPWNGLKKWKMMTCVCINF